MKRHFRGRACPVSLTAVVRAVSQPFNVIFCDDILDDMVVQPNLAEVRTRMTLKTSARLNADKRKIELHNEGSEIDRRCCGVLPLCALSKRSSTWTPVCRVDHRHWKPC